LAYHVERLVEDGSLKDYAEAAKLLGMSRARMTQVVNLLHLSPEIQERILLETLAVSERRIRRVGAEAEWSGQKLVAGT